MRHRILIPHPVSDGSWPARASVSGGSCCSPGAMHAAVLIAGPFFVLYMLRDLHLAYWGYGTWLAAGILGQLVTLAAWGRFADRFGNKALLTVTGFMVPFLPMLYLAGTSLPFLLFVNFLGGVTWGGLALGLQNYVFDAVRPEDRAKAVATYSTVNALGMVSRRLYGQLVGTYPAIRDCHRTVLPRRWPQTFPSYFLYPACCDWRFRGVF